MLERERKRERERERERERDSIFSTEHMIEHYKMIDVIPPAKIMYKFELIVFK